MFYVDFQTLQVEDVHHSTLELFSLNSITWLVTANSQYLFPVIQIGAVRCVIQVSTEATVPSSNVCARY